MNRKFLDKGDIEGGGMGRGKGGREGLGRRRDDIEVEGGGNLFCFSLTLSNFTYYLSLKRL